MPRTNVGTEGKLPDPDMNVPHSVISAALRQTKLVSWLLLAIRI